MKSTGKNVSLGVISLIATTLLYSSFGVLSRAIGFKLPLFYQSWTRGALNSVILIILIVALKQWRKIRAKDLFWIISRPLVGVVAFTASFISFNFLKIGTAYFLVYGASTIGGYTSSFFIFKEKLTFIKVFSLILSLVGLSLIYTITFETENSVYMLLAIGAGIGTALWNTLTKKISHIYTEMQMNFFDIFIFFVSCFTISFILKEQWEIPTISVPWVANLLLGFVFITAGQLIVYGFKHVDAQIGSLIMLLEVVFGILIGFFFFGENLSFLTILGGVLILIAVALPEINWKKLKI